MWKDDPLPVALQFDGTAIAGAHDTEVALIGLMVDSLRKLLALIVILGSS